MFTLIFSIVAVFVSFGLLLKEILESNKRYANLQTAYTLALIELETTKFVLELERKSH